MPSMLDILTSGSLSSTPSRGSLVEMHKRKSASAFSFTNEDRFSNYGTIHEFWDLGSLEMIVFSFEPFTILSIFALNL